jgi:hypothetical protein
MALDDYNDELIVPWQQSDAPGQIINDGEPSLSVYTLAGPDDEAYQLQWLLKSDTRFQGLVSEFESVKYTRAIAWTPMGVGSSANFKFESFSTTAVSPSRWQASATLKRYNGV